LKTSITFNKKYCGMSTVCHCGEIREKLHRKL